MKPDRKCSHCDRKLIDNVKAHCLSPTCDWCVKCFAAKRKESGLV